jgi:1-acyl-sn-glycerol-3-phosphate acyltransferase
MGSMSNQAALDKSVELLMARLNRLGIKRLAQLSKLRAKLWGLVLSIFTAGLTSFKGEKQFELFRKVPLPEGPLVVVANHVSHIDSVALVTMIGRSRPVLVVAGADYWLTDKASELIARLAIGIWPIRRGSEQAFDDLMLSSDLVKAGVVVVVFPEGGRSEDGQVQEFHSGAFRLAESTGATVLPIAVVNSDKVLPRKAISAKHKPLNLRIGEPFKVDSVESAKDAAQKQVVELHKSPVIDAPGFGFSRVRRIAFGWVGLLVIFFWAFGEGIFWPLVAEMPLLLLVVTVGFRWRGALLIAVSALGSVLGVLTTWWLVDKGINPPSPLTTSNMFDYARREMIDSPNSAFWDQMWNGIPVKVYAHEAGALHLSFLEVLQSLVPRVLRIMILGAGGWLLGTTLAKWLKPNLGLVQAVALIAFPFGLAQAIWFWSIYKG